MMDDCGMSAYCYFAIPQPRNTLANIFYVFAGYCHYNIIWFSKFLLLGSFFTNICNGFIYKKTIAGIDLPVMDTGNARFSKVLFLKASASTNSRNVAQTSVWHTIRA